MRLSRRQLNGGWTTRGKLELSAVRSKVTIFSAVPPHPPTFSAAEKKRVETGKRPLGTGPDVRDLAGRPRASAPPAGADRRAGAPPLSRIQASTVSAVPTGCTRMAATGGLSNYGRSGQGSQLFSGPHQTSSDRIAAQSQADHAGGRIMAAVIIRQ